MKNLGTALAARKQETCEHLSNISVHSGGIERLICEKCGHVSFEFAEMQLSEVEREQFARDTDHSVEEA